MQVLLVEDQREVVAFLRKGLEENGFSVQVAGDGLLGYDWATCAKFDLIILDVMLPGLDGLELCRKLRSGGTTSRILMLTALASVDERVAGFEAGADDYLSKPFAFRELLARLRALVRRNEEPRASTLMVGDLTLDLHTRRACLGTQGVDLSAKEFTLLEAFMRQPDRVLSRTVLLEQVWGYDYRHRSNILEVYVQYLRQKLDRDHGPSRIETVRGAGYRLVQ